MIDAPDLSRSDDDTADISTRFKIGFSINGTPHEGRRTSGGIEHFFELVYSQLRRIAKCCSFEGSVWKIRCGFPSLSPHSLLSPFIGSEQLGMKSSTNSGALEERIDHSDDIKRSNND